MLPKVKFYLGRAKCAARIFPGSIQFEKANLAKRLFLVPALFPQGQSEFVTF